MSSEHHPVSVVMPVYNGEKYLAEAIESILAQTFSDFELIIVDDGSTDGSGEIIRSYEKRDKRIRVIQHESNLGVSVARNTGIAAAAGEYVAFTDCDDVSLPRRLEKQTAFLNANPRIGAVGVAANIVTEDLQPLRTYNVPTNSSFIAFNLVNRGANMIFAAMLTRREYLEASGGYRSDFKILEDNELFTRMIWKTGIRYANIPEILYLYRQHGASLSHVVKDSTPGGDERAKREAVEKAKREALEVLWGEVSDQTFESLDCLHPSSYPTWVKLNWRERRRSRRNMYRLIDSMIAANWADASDRTALREEADKRIEKTMPRRWQRFLHWRRKRFGGRD